MRANTEKDFWGRVEKTKACWEWQGPLNEKGYGLFPRGGKISRAHREARGKG